MNKNRVNRINSEMQKAVYSAINKFTQENFPGTLISVTKVTTTEDLYESKVFLSIYSINKDYNSKKILAEIEKKKNLIKEIVAHEVNLRRMPNLKFILDDGFDEAQKIEGLLTKIKKYDDK